MMDGRNQGDVRGTYDESRHRTELRGGDSLTTSWDKMWKKRERMYCERVILYLYF